MSAQRREPRFVSRQEIELFAPDRAETRRIWTENISKGGLFVVTDEPPPLRSRVKVRLAVPEGALELQAEVVHMVNAQDAAAWGTKAGVGLQFVELSPKQVTALSAYCEGIAAALAAQESVDLPSANTSTNELLNAVQTLFSGTDANDLYGAISSKSTATEAELMAQLQRLAELFQHGSKSIPPAQRARVENASRLLARIRRLLGDPARRLDHDLRQGLLRLEMVIQRPLHEQRKIRDAWKLAFPERLADAEKISLEAARRAAGRDLAGAVQLGEQALRLDPLNTMLRETVREWRAQKAKG